MTRRIASKRAPRTSPATSAWAQPWITWTRWAWRTLLRIIGNAPEKAAVVSFLLEGAHAPDLATLLDLEGVAVRSGHHCAHPLMHFFGVPATCRASLAFYNTHAEIEAFIAALAKVRKLLC